MTESENMWRFCNEFGRAAGGGAHTLLFAVQIKSIIWPTKGTNERVVNYFYMLFTCVSYIIIWLSYKPKYGVKFSVYSFVLLILRLNIRLLDFEFTKEVLGDFKWISIVI